MTFAWYAHLKNLSHKPWIIAASASWGIALFETCCRCPQPGRVYRDDTVATEVITLTVFLPFLVLYMRQPLKLDYLWAGLGLVGAVYFMFREGIAFNAS